jgi:hypothetical protein
MTARSDRADALRHLQVAARQVVLACAGRDHRDEQGARLLNLLYVHRGCAAVGASLDEARAAIDAGVLAAEKELAEPKPERTDRAEKGHARAVVAAGRMIASNYRSKTE